MHGWYTNEEVGTVCVAYQSACAGGHYGELDVDVGDGEMGTGEGLMDNGEGHKDWGNTVLHCLVRPAQRQPKLSHQTTRQGIERSMTPIKVQDILRGKILQTVQQHFKSNQ